MLKADKLDIFRFNFLLAAKTLSGLRMVVGGTLGGRAGYLRWMEYPLVFNNLELERGLTLLDVGSGQSIFPLFVRFKGVRVWATDLDQCVFKLKNHAMKLGIYNIGFHIEVQDARKLTYPDSSFDRASAISSLEHIRSGGDLRALREIYRVLKKGGIAVITLPFGLLEKEITNIDGGASFGKVYSSNSIQLLIDFPGWKLKRIEYFIETKFGFRAFWRRLPRLVKIPFHWMLPLFSHIFLTKTGDESLIRYALEERSFFIRTAGVCLTLEKCS